MSTSLSKNKREKFKSIVIPTDDNLPQERSLGGVNIESSTSNADNVDTKDTLPEPQNSSNTNAKTGLLPETQQNVNTVEVETKKQESGNTSQLAAPTVSAKPSKGDIYAKLMPTKKKKSRNRAPDGYANCFFYIKSELNDELNQITQETEIPKITLLNTAVDLLLAITSIPDIELIIDGTNKTFRECMVDAIKQQIEVKKRTR